MTFQEFQKLTMQEQADAWASMRDSERQSMLEAKMAGSEPERVSPRPPTCQPPPKLPNQVQATAKPPKKTNRIIQILFVVLLISLFCSYPRLHNNHIREQLKLCETYGVVRADVYYASVFTSDVVVFDLKGESSSHARRIDPVHLLLQFATKLDYSSLGCVILAYDGRQIFYVSATDLNELASSYDAGGRIWSFNNLPERCRTMSGDRTYDTWSGGWLGVTHKQTADLNSLIRDWTGY